MDCLLCGGAGCEECGEYGRWELTQCPKDFITGDVWEVIEMAALYEKGLPPVAGGSLDQAQIFLDASRLIWSEQKKWEIQLKGPFADG